MILEQDNADGWDELWGFTLGRSAPRIQPHGLYEGPIIIIFLSRLCFNAL